MSSPETFHQFNREIVPRLMQVFLPANVHNGHGRTVFRRVDEQKDIIGVEFAANPKSNAGASGLFDDVPEDFQFPALGIHDFRYGRDSGLVRTPWGLLPHLVTDDGDIRLWGFATFYLFGFDLRALRVESWTYFGKLREVEGYRPGELRKVPDLPLSDGASFGEMEPGDYEKVNGLLALIENGEYRRADDNS